MSDTRPNPIKVLSTQGSVPCAKPCSVREKSNKEICGSARGLEGTQTIDCCRPSSPFWSILHSWDAGTSGLMGDISHDASDTRGRAFALAKTQLFNLFIILSPLQYRDTINWYRIDAQRMCESNGKLERDKIGARVCMHLCADGCYLLM